MPGERLRKDAEAVSGQKRASLRVGDLWDVRTAWAELSLEDSIAL